MSTTAIVVIVIAIIVVLAVGGYILRQRQARQLEERRIEAGRAAEHGRHEG